MLAVHLLDLALRLQVFKANCALHRIIAWLRSELLTLVGVNDVANLALRRLRLISLVVTVGHILYAHVFLTV